MFSLDFPRKDVIEELEKKGWLKLKTKVEINNSLWDKKYSVRLLGNLANRYYYVLLPSLVIIYNLASVLLKDYEIIARDNFYPFLIYVLLFSVLIIGSFLSFKKTEKNLGYLELSETFLEFLRKFGGGWDVKIAEMPGRIFFLILRIFKKGEFHRKWWIEWDLLIGAHRLFEENPQEFEKAVRKAKNKKELRWLLGIS